MKAMESTNRCCSITVEKHHIEAPRGNDHGTRLYDQRPPLLYDRPTCNALGPQKRSVRVSSNLEIPVLCLLYAQLLLKSLIL
jgi:hypothetical protein